MGINHIGIIGAGVMGEALIISLTRSGIEPNSIVVVEKRAERRAEISSKYSVISSSIKDCEIVFLLVKPQDLGSTLDEFRTEISQSALVISFVAGKSTAFIESHLYPNQRVIRVMPNTPMTVGKGFAAASGGKYANDSDFHWLKLVLSSSCKLISIAEDEQDAITALSGSGPAYFFAMVEAMAEAGERLGLSEEDALSAAKEVLVGAAAMVEKSGKEPKTLRENVTSPNGTTFAALSAFQEGNFQEIVFKAMKAARDRSIELSK